jgi:hypothetical protein
MLNINQLVIVGGGRWSRQIIKTLVNKIKIKNSIICITNKKNFFLRKWIKKYKLKNKIILAKKIPENESRNSLAIICNSTRKHYQSVILALNKNYNVFIEKPISENLSQAKSIYRIGKKLKKNIYCSNVYRYSSYLKKFINYISNKKINNIEFIWHDKLNEYRYGELKKHDAKTTIYFDVLFHIFSLLDIFFKDKKYLISSLKKVFFEKNKALLSFEAKSIKINVDLNNKAKKRMRLLIFKNLNYRYIINFSENEGKFIIFNNRSNIYNKKYSNVRYPLFLMLNKILSDISKNITKVPSEISILKTLNNFQKIDKIIKY